MRKTVEYSDDNMILLADEELLVIQKVEYVPTQSGRINSFFVRGYLSGYTTVDDETQLYSANVMGSVKLQYEEKEDVLIKGGFTNVPWGYEKIRIIEKTLKLQSLSDFYENRSVNVY